MTESKQASDHMTSALDSSEQAILKNPVTYSDVGSNNTDLQLRGSMPF
jgi:hypothetical protein